tara:strand:+ start:1208 stop:1723 length:516 start_codon:yes stop_codon:yes gene_type:complete
MKIFRTKFKDLLIIKCRSFKDKRGILRFAFDDRILKKKFVFEYSTISKKNVFRGFHLQTKFKHSKLITVLKGEIIDYVIDLRKNSKTYGKCFKVNLSDKNLKSIYIPEGFAHGYYIKKNDTLIYCKQSNYYRPRYVKNIAWDNPKFKIKFPFKKPILSRKDRRASSFHVDV